ncbi:tetratricopeptide repeat protein [Pseudobacteriovorax antillogorgiicola]|uniref:Uncharacterized protein n=2 Tax=Pseudobacteriovorax antillogorgiicola TaxID=1513793 RepID=A0A1Y6BIN9_9BACT|nr:tetratricopeptide repeat protein [Pseudobacteriovorax antillogorgiicola]TCS55364.1 hypothetical protein EDD56_10585 [Pseudobacteriovorax antillogorgiicola]SMF13511.1 hypothetical protein SAMN06296036_105239 [Pseudobacteriovorax antillogorgiicola]
MLSFPIVSKTLAFLSLIASMVACQSSPDSPASTPYQEMVQGTISYPFYLETEPLGTNGKEDKFVIRTISGDTEYVIEIPRAATDYDVAVPLAQSKESLVEEPKVRNPQLTDRELTSQFPQLDAQTEEERALLDKAFGVSEKEGPRQAPSYTVGLAKVGKLYKKHQYEYALIEVNNLLAFYPNSSRLYKMKGSILIRLGNLQLAEKSWLRAGELAPEDPVIRRGLAQLRKRIESNRNLARNNVVSSTTSEPPPANESGESQGNAGNLPVIAPEQPPAPSQGSPATSIR